MFSDRLRRCALVLALLALVLTPGSAQEAIPAAGEPDAARIPTPQTDRPDRASLAYALVSWKGAERAVGTVTRTKEEARARAEQLVAHVRSKGVDFHEAVSRFSDDPNAARNGGRFGIVAPGQLPPDLDRVGFGLGVGQVSDPVESSFGWVVLHRSEIEEVSASHILLMYQGSNRAPPNVTRSKEEARKQIDDLLARIRAGGNLADLAREHSDCPSKQQGGSLGIFGRGQMTPPFEKAAFALKEGDVSEVVETEFGFHIIQRNRIERVRASHILLSYQGAQGAGAARTKEQAKKLAEQLLADLKGGKDFAAVARENSDCPSSRQGGDLGTFGRGQMVPEFERAAFALQTGQVSEVVESPFGFHLILRTK